MSKESNGNSGVSSDNVNSMAELYRLIERPGGVRPQDFVAVLMRLNSKVEEFIQKKEKEEQAKPAIQSIASAVGGAMSSALGFAAEFLLNIAIFAINPLDPVSFSGSDGYDATPPDAKSIRDSYGNDMHFWLGKFFSQMYKNGVEREALTTVIQAQIAADASNKNFWQVVLQRANDVYTQHSRQTAVSNVAHALPAVNPVHGQSGALSVEREVRGGVAAASRSAVINKAATVSVGDSSRPIASVSANSPGYRSTIDSDLFTPYELFVAKSLNKILPKTCADPEYRAAKSEISQKLTDADMIKSFWSGQVVQPLDGVYHAPGGTITERKINGQLYYDIQGRINANILIPRVESNGQVSKDKFDFVEVVNGKIHCHVCNDLSTKSLLNVQAMKQQQSMKSISESSVSIGDNLTPTALGVGAHDRQNGVGGKGG